MISSLSASHMQFICSFLLAAAFHFLRWRKTPSHRNLGFQPPFMRTWATASGPPLDELPAKNRFGKNFPHSEISESWRGVQKTTKRMGKKRKGKARLTKNTPEKHDLRAKTTVTQIVATSHHAAMVRSNRRGDSRAPGTGAGRAGGMGTGRGCERRSLWLSSKRRKWLSEEEASQGRRVLFPEIKPLRGYLTVRSSSIC